MDNQTIPGQAHPVMVKQPCGFCGNNPPYMCRSCNDYSDDLFEPHGDRRSINGSVPADFWFP